MSAKLETVGEAALQGALRRLAERATNAEPAMRSVSMALLRETERIFANEGKGVGLEKPWAPLSETTKHQRALAQSSGKQYGKNGKELKRYSGAKSGAMKMLQVSGKLAASVTPVSNGHEAGITTNRKYAAAMFFGAKKGQFGTDRRNHPIPWGDRHSWSAVPADSGPRQRLCADRAGSAIGARNTEAVSGAVSAMSDGRGGTLRSSRFPRPPMDNCAAHTTRAWRAPA